MSVAMGDLDDDGDPDIVTANVFGSTVSVLLNLSLRPEAPTITDVRDVGNDQGRNVRISWWPSRYDAPDDTLVVSGYGVHRRQDAYVGRRFDEPLSAPTCLGGDGRLPMLEGWDGVAYVPARCDSAYQSVVPTVCDSTLSSGICWSVFMVSGVTAEPWIYFDSAPDSGYSVDNLAPGAPLGLLADGDETLVALSWDPNEEADLSYYAIYRDTFEFFSPVTPIGYAGAEYHEDASPPGAHTAVWDGRDGAGADAASGVYFCSMEAGGYSSRRKMVLLK